MALTKDQAAALGRKLPDWALKPHPTRRGMSAIHPMAVIERLNEVFGVGGWNFKVDCIAIEPFEQSTKSGIRAMFRSAVKGTFTVGDIHIEQFGGSQNDDMGDALKGGGTDALTKIASYLGVGASVYRNEGNVDLAQPLDIQECIDILEACTNRDELTAAFKALPAEGRSNQVIRERSKAIADSFAPESSVAS